YRKVSVYTFKDSRFKGMSSPAPCAQYLYIYLQIGSETSHVPGVVANYGPAGLGEALGWTRDEVMECFAEIKRNGLGVADWENRLIFLPEVLAENPPDNKNVAVGWMRFLNELPQCGLKGDILNAIIKTSNGWLHPDKSEPQDEEPCFHHWSEHDQEEV